MLVGLETNFTLSAGSALNTTFLAAAIGVTYLCFDPLVKAAYVLRCFYGEARTTGEDLRVMLRYLNTATVSFVAALVLLASTARAAESPAPARNPPATARANELDRSIDDVLKRREYAWRTPRPKPEAKAKEESAMLKRIRDWLKNTFKSFFEWLGRMLGKLFRPRGGVGPSKFSFTTQGLVYILIAIVAAVIIVLLWMLWRSRSRLGETATEAMPATPVPDLESEDVTGEELPVDGWTQLALELLARGELRLAMRAFYFSSLAHLAERNLISLARFKSNRDYERELRRRSHALPEITRFFSDNVSVFDRVWYGRHEINADLLQDFRSNVERIRGW
jgi:hypothetical protein